jgi:hypothetical protein
LLYLTGQPFYGLNMDISKPQNYNEISHYWPNPYEAQAVYVPLAELVKAYGRLNQMCETNDGGKVLATEDVVIDSWTHGGLLWVDAYIVTQAPFGYSAGVRFGEDSAVLTPGFNTEMLAALYKKYCPKAHSKCSTASARMKWHTDVENGYKQELHVVVDRGHDSLEFSAEELFNLLCQTNPTYAQTLIKQANRNYAVAQANKKYAA